MNYLETYSIYIYANSKLQYFINNILYLYTVIYNIPQTYKATRYRTVGNVEYRANDPARAIDKFNLFP